METTDPAAELYDMYTVIQLKAIAKFNNVQHRPGDKKLNIAKAIVDQTNGQYDIPDDMPLATKLHHSRLHALRGKKANEYRDKKRKEYAKHYENAMSEEELATNEDYQRITRFIKDEPKPDPNEKIAVYSKRNVYWANVGKLAKGYNFITREESEKWLRLSGVREATPEEVAAHFDI